MFYNISDSLYGFLNQPAKQESEIKTPWVRANKLIGGFIPGDLITLSATPKTGKTTLALNISLETAENYIPTLFYCLEMRKERLAKKVTDCSMKKHKLKGNYSEMVEFLKRTPLYFLDYPTKIDYPTIKKDIMQAVEAVGIKFLVFDNLHFLARNTNDVVREVGYISREFKVLAETLNIPVLLIAQPKKVQADTVMSMNDLKDSSAIGADSDQVIILWREKTISKKNEIQDSAYKPETLFRVDASRFHAGGDCWLYYHGESSYFEEIK